MAKTTGRTGGSGYGKKMLALSKTAKKSRKTGKLMVGLWDQLAAQAEDNAERKRDKMMSDDLKQARKRKDRAATPKSIRRPITANEKADEYHRKRMQLKEDMRLFLRGTVKHSTARIKARRKRADEIVGIVTSKKAKPKIPKSLRKNK